MISDLYDALCAVFKEFHCPVVVFLGEQYRAQHTVPLRVVLYQGAASPADQFKGANPASLSTQQTRQAINPRPVATRRCGFSVELWATAPTQRNQADQFRANQAYLDALVNQFCAAMQAITSGIFTLEGGKAAAGNADASVAGLGYTFLCYCDVPVTSVRWPAQQLSECSTTWRYATATADVAVNTEVQLDPPTYVSGPEFTAP